MLSRNTFLCEICIKEPLVEQKEYIAAIQCLPKLGYNIEQIRKGQNLFIKCLCIADTTEFLCLSFEKTLNALAFVWRHHVKASIHSCDLEPESKIDVAQAPPGGDISHAFCHHGYNALTLSWEIQNKHTSIDNTSTSTIHFFELNELLVSSSSQEREMGLIFQALKLEEIQQDYMRGEESL